MVDKKEQGLIGKIQRSRNKAKAAEAKGDTLVSQIEGRVVANAQSVLPSLPPEAVEETLRAFWNTDEEVSIKADTVYPAVERVMERLRVVNPGLAKIVEEFDSAPPSEKSASYLTTMILAALTHDSTPRPRG